MGDLAERGLYFYGVARREAAGEPLHREGVQPDEPVEFLVQGALAAVISPVCLQEFAPQRVEARLTAGETQWVEEKALAQATVLHEVMQRGPVIPIRFGIIFRDPGRLRSILSAQEAEFVALLDRLTGKVEWGVKVLYQDEELKGALGRDDPAVMALQERLKGMPPGTAYLHRKKLDLLLEEKAQEFLPQCAQRIHKALVELSEAAEALDASGQEQVKPDQRMALHGAYLVREETTGRFWEELDSLAGEYQPWGLQLDLSGPWPPYHFAQVQFGAETR